MVTFEVSFQVALWSTTVKDSVKGAVSWSPKTRWPSSGQSAGVVKVTPPSPRNTACWATNDVYMPKKGTGLASSPSPLVMGLPSCSSKNSTTWVTLSSVLTGNSSLPTIWLPSGAMYRGMMVLPPSMDAPSTVLREYSA